MRAIARAQLRDAIAERARAVREYQRSIGTAAERAKLVRLQAANLAVSMRERALRIAAARNGGRTTEQLGRRTA